MANLEDIIQKIPELANNLKLTIDNSSQIRRQISKIDSLQDKLIEVDTVLEEAINSERFNKGVLGAIPFLGTIASFFIPGGFLVDALVGFGSGILAEKLGDPDKETTLIDIIETVEALVEWGNTLKDLGEQILSDSEVLRELEQGRKSLGLAKQVKQVDETLKIHLEFTDYQELKRQNQQIKAAQESLKKLQPKLDQVFQNFQEDVEIMERIKAYIRYFGKSIFAIEWIDDDLGLILSCNNQTKSHQEIGYECESLTNEVDKLVTKANTLRGQAEQAIKQLEIEHHRKQEQQEAHLQRRIKEKQERKSQKQLEQSTQISSNQKLIGINWIPIFSIFTIGCLGFIGWKIGFKLPQVQQASETLNSSAAVASSKIISEQQTSVLAPNKAESKTYTEQQHIIDFEMAQKLAMEAAVLVQNPPHPIEVWEQATAKWQESVKLLESIPESSPIFSQAQAKLLTYQTNYTAINNRLNQEKKAVIHLENAKKLAWEAAVIVQNPPHPIETWQKAESKLKQAISLLELIPKGTLVEAKAQEKLRAYQTNLSTITNQIQSR